MKRSAAGLLAGLILLSSAPTAGAIGSTMVVTGTVIVPENEYAQMFPVTMADKIQMFNASQLSLSSSPEINVLVPETGEVVINPYCMEVEVDGELVRDQVSSPVYTIENNSEVPVMVDAAAQASFYKNSGASLVSRVPDKDAAQKELFLYLELQSEYNMWEPSYSDASNQMLIGNGEIRKTGMLAVDAAGQAYLRFSGAASPNPQESWSADDGLNVTLIFTFSSLANNINLESVPEDEATTMKLDDMLTTKQPSQNVEQSGSEDTSVPQDANISEQSPKTESEGVSEDTPVPEYTNISEQPPKTEDEDAPDKTSSSEEDNEAGERPSSEDADGADTLDSQGSASVIEIPSSEDDSHKNNDSTNGSENPPDTSVPEGDYNSEYSASADSDSVEGTSAGDESGS